MKLHPFPLSSRCRSSLGNLVLCCGLSTAVATTTEQNGGLTPSVRERFAGQASSLLQQGVLHVDVDLNAAQVEQADTLEIQFALMAPPSVSAVLSITPDYPGDAFAARIGDGTQGCPGCRSEVVERDGGVESASDRGAWNSVEYVVSFAREANACPSTLRAIVSAGYGR